MGIPLHWAAVSADFESMAMEVTSPDRRSVAERLKAATEELQKLEQVVISGDCAPRVLCDFRDAVDSIRQTAWAVKQWGELQEQHRDPYTVLDLLSEEYTDYEGPDD